MDPYNVTQNERVEAFKPSKVMLMKGVSAEEFRAPPAKPRFGKRVPYGAVVGKLTIGPKAHKNRCKVTCECGYVGRLANRTVLQLLNDGVGCQKPYCEKTVDREAMAAANSSLELQLFLLSQVCNNELPSRWGGSLDDFEELTPKQGYRNFLADMLEGRKPEEQRWIARERPGQPFIIGNIVLTRTPNHLIERAGGIPVDAGAGVMLIEDICVVAGAELSNVLTYARRRGSFQGILSALLS